MTVSNLPGGVTVTGVCPGLARRRSGSREAKGWPWARSDRCLSITSGLNYERVLCRRPYTGPVVRTWGVKEARIGALRPAPANDQPDIHVVAGIH
jgi:hypothetical protein